MKRLLIKFETTLAVFRLLELRINYNEFVFAIWDVERDEMNPETLQSYIVDYYTLFKFCYYRSLPDWASVRAELWLFNRHYPFERKVGDSDELPF